MSVLDQIPPKKTDVARNKNKLRRRRKRDDDDDDDDAQDSATPKKKLAILSLTKPSYVLALGGTKNIRTENRARLQRLLDKLVTQHKWKEASGVLSVLLKATCNCNNKTKPPLPLQNSNKYYWVAMELLLQFLDSNSVVKIKDVFGIWMRKVGSMPLEDRFAVHVEYIIYCLQIGNLGEAHECALCLMEENEFARHGTSLMVVGFVYYQMWYVDIPKEMKLQNVDSDTQSHMSTLSGGGRFSYLHDNSNGSYADDVDRPCDSETSVGIDKIIFEHDATVNSVVQVSAQVGVSLEGETLQQSFNPQSFYMNSADSENEEASFENYGDNSVFSVQGGLDPWLLPIQLSHSDGNANVLQRGMINYNYKAAVKYFDLALESNPPVLAALSPLVQLLMAGQRVKQALSLVEKFCQNANTTLPFRLRARILERFDPSDPTLISSCYEDVLENDPTCRYSLEKLISMHRHEDYSPELLVEMISLHLDATYGEVSLWKEFATCLLKLSKDDEDRMSGCRDGNKYGVDQSYSIRYNRIPKVFVEDVQSAKSWIFRCKWWLQRHFSEKVLLSEISVRNVPLLTYKAACACHLYGQSFEYVMEVKRFIEQEERDMRMFLLTHMQNSVGFYLSFAPKSKGRGKINP